MAKKPNNTIYESSSSIGYVDKKITPKNFKNSPLKNILNPKIVKDIANLKIFENYINESIVVFTTYGPSVDEFMKEFLLYPAANQLNTANISVKKIFGDIFKSDTHPRFNFRIRFSKKVDFKKLRVQYPKYIPINELESIIKEEKDDYYHAEIDGALQLNLYPKENTQNLSNTINKKRDKKYNKKSSDIDKYTFIEIKLFTAPLEDESKVIERNLQKGNLEKYFKYRNLFGLLGFSFVFDTENTEYVPIAENDSVFEANKKSKDIDGDNGNKMNAIKSIWAMHLILMDYSILSTTKNAPNRSKLILSAINEHQSIMMQNLDYGNNYKVGLTNNLIKVVKMYQQIEELKNDLKAERKKTEAERKKTETERRILEEKLKKSEIERKKSEIERKKSEIERKKLEEKLKKFEK